MHTDVLCKRQNVNGYPTVKLIDEQRNIHDQLNGEISVRSLNNFYWEKSLKHFIKSANDIEIAEKITNIKQTSVLTYYSNQYDDKSVEESYKEKLLDLPNPKPEIFIKHASKRHISIVRDSIFSDPIELPSNYSSETISNFSLSLLPELDTNIINKFNNSQRIILTFILPSSKYLSEIKSIKKTILPISQSVQFTYAIYDIKNPLIFELEIRRPSQISLYAINIQTNKYLQYNGKLNTRNVAKWVASVESSFINVNLRDYIIFDHVNEWKTMFIILTMAIVLYQSFNIRKKILNNKYYDVLTDESADVRDLIISQPEI